MEYLPTPLTGPDSTITDTRKDETATPPESPRKDRQHSPSQPQLSHAVSSPPEDTQALSQFVYPPRAFADEVEDEAAEGVWGYLLPLDEHGKGPLVLRKRNQCGDDGNSPNVKSGKNAQSPGGFLVGRHPECGKCKWLIDKEYPLTTTRSCP